MPRTPESEISSVSAWEYHKGTIQRIYLSENKSLKSLVEIMQKSHNFFASKAQYERMFKEWGFRKNSKSQEWRAVGYHISKRKREGKDSDVFFHNQLVPPQKVRKEIMRNTFRTTWEKQIEVTSPNIPGGFAIRSPQLLPFEVTKTDNLPWLRFRSLFEYTDTRTLVKVDRNTAGPSPVDSYQSQTARKILESTQRAVMDSILRARSGAPNLASSLRCLIPERHVGESQSVAQMMPGPITPDTILRFLNIAVYLASNDLLLPQSEIRYEFVRRLQWAGHIDILEKILSVSCPTTEAFAESLFRIACQAGGIKIVKFLLQTYPETKSQMLNVLYDGLSPLQCAINNEFVELAGILIEAGASVNPSAESAHHDPVLGMAAHTGNLELINMLLAAGAEINAQDTEGDTALHKATSMGRIEACRSLLCAGADVDIANHCGHTSLHSAAQEGDLMIIEMYIDAGADIEASTDSDETALSLASDEEHDHIVRRILEIDPTINGALFAAVKSGCIDFVHSLLDTRVSVNSCSTQGFTALTAAAFRNDAKLARLLLEHGANVNGCSSESCYHGKVVTPLQIASMWDNMELVEVLLHAGADVNARLPDSEPHSMDWNRASPIQIAVSEGNFEIVKILLEAGATITKSEEPGFIDYLEYTGTALQIAAYVGDLALTRMLLKAGAYINAPAYSKGGRTALQAAAQWGYHDIIRCLLDAGADIEGFAAEDNGSIALTAAILDGSTESISLLIESGADVNNPSAKISGLTALTAAAASNDSNLVKYLLRLGADTNDPDALFSAVQNRSSEIAQILLTAYASVSGRRCKKYGTIALQEAIISGQSTMVRMLLAAGINVNTPASTTYKRRPSCHDGATALESAVGFNGFSGFSLENLAMVKLLLDAGAEPNITMRYYSNTVLIEAVSKANVQLVKLLLDAGAKVNILPEGRYQRTALQKAAEKGNIDIVTILLAAGADVNGPPSDHGGITALQAAAIGGFFGIAQMLLENNANVNAPPARAEGRTALEGAAEHGRIDMVQLLIDFDAQIHGPGETQYERALSLAEQNGHFALYRLLRSCHSQ